MTMTREELIGAFEKSERDSRGDKELLREQIQQDIERFRAQGGEITVLNSGDSQLNGSASVGFNAGSPNNLVDSAVAASICGVTQMGLKQGELHGKLKGRKFPKARMIQGRRMYRVQALMDWRDGKTPRVA